MEYMIKIKRKADTKSQSYAQDFLYTGDASVSVAFVLEELNNRVPLLDIDGNPAPTIGWECGCLQQKCGACAMLINGLPHLACSTFLNTLSHKKNTILLEPLSKFPVVSDLIVDRSIIFENLKRMKLWLEEEAHLSGWTHEQQYQSARCLMCGCCLEVCPNFSVTGNFSGALSAVNAYRVFEQNTYGEHHSEMVSKYRKYYFEGCGKSLSCHTICPAKLPVEDLIVRSNAAGVWGK